MKSNEWVYITEQKNIPLREGRSVTLDGEAIALFNLGDKVLAVDDRCPHRGGPLSDGMVTGDVIVCPLHYAKFCLKTGAGRTPEEPEACVKSYPVKIEEGRIFIAPNLASMPGAEFVAEAVNC